MMNQLVVNLLFFCVSTYSIKIWDILYYQKYLTTVPNNEEFVAVTVDECYKTCRQNVKKCNIAIYNEDTVNFSNVV